jgi:hypothetical protein
MIPGNNFAEIKEINGILNELLDATARIGDILRRNGGLEEAEQLWRDTQRNQEEICDRLHAYKRALGICEQKLETSRVGRTGCKWHQGSCV